MIATTRLLVSVVSMGTESHSTVAALGALSENPREYSARPILFSADCKSESGSEHARNVLRPLVTAINNKSERGNTKFRLVSVASDGESRRGIAFAKEYMKKPLSPDSPIFPHLEGLWWEMTMLHATRITSTQLNVCVA